MGRSPKKIGAERSSCPAYKQVRTQSAPYGTGILWKTHDFMIPHHVASPIGAKLLTRIKTGVDEVHSLRGRFPRECNVNSYSREKGDRLLQRVSHNRSLNPQEGFGREAP